MKKCDQLPELQFNSVPTWADIRKQTIDGMEEWIVTDKECKRWVIISEDMSTKELQIRIEALAAALIQAECGGLYTRYPLEEARAQLAGRSILPEFELVIAAMKKYPLKTETGASA